MFCFFTCRRQQKCSAFFTCRRQQKCLVFFTCRRQQKWCVFFTYDCFYAKHYLFCNLMWIYAQTLLACMFDISLIVPVCDVLIWNSWTVFLVEVSGHKIESSQTPFLYPIIFPFYKMLLMKKLEFSCFADFLYVFLKPEKSEVLFKIRQKKGLWITWSKRLLSNWCPRIPSPYARASVRSCGVIRTPPICALKKSCAPRPRVYHLYSMGQFYLSLCWGGSQPFRERERESDKFLLSDQSLVTKPLRRRYP